MTENDYIAEYIKERHPALLGADYAFWKFGKLMSNAAKALGNALRSIDWSKIDLPESYKAESEGLDVIKDKMLDCSNVDA